MKMLGRNLLAALSAIVLIRDLACTPQVLAADSRPIPPAASHTVDFGRDIEPLLSSQCYNCHGAKKQEAGLRLDIKSEALKGGDSGPLLSKGNGAESLLVQVLAGAREDIARMPKKGDPLSAEQIGLIRAWIDQGAQWPDSPALETKARKDHWAFTPPVKPGIAVVKNDAWPKNPVDHFILARLEKEGLQPSPEANRATLLRRLSLDLIGLPPSIEELDAFLADTSSDAYEKQVERLLMSPHYGERWGRHWLDAARYADSDGFEKDKSRNVWFYRDWVINAFNNDMPYDRFIIEQIAGDLLPNARQDQIVATGFLRNSMINEEGGVDPEQFRMDAMFDRMDCIGKGVLGLTIQCAQCHNHKYDPISQEEYYRIFAFLNNDYEAQQVVYSFRDQMKVADLSRQIREQETELKHRNPDWQERMAKWEKEISENKPNWVVLRPSVDDISTGGQKYLPQKDGSFLAQSYAPTKHTAKMTVTNEFKNISAFQIELLNDPNLPANGPGRSFKGTCALTEFKVEAADAANPTNKFWIKFSEATADFEQATSPLEPNFDDKSTNKRVVGPVKYAIDGDNNTAWGIDAGPGRRNQERKAVFQCVTNVGFASGTILTFHLTQNHGGWNSDDHMNNNLGRFRLSLISESSPVVADPVPARVRKALSVPREHRTPAQINEIFSYWRTTVPEWKETNEQIERLWKEWPEGSTSLTLMARGENRDTRILKRGDFLKPMKSVDAGVPAFLHPLPKDATPNRLTFAQWLVDRKSPTTARVMVNRIWQSYFGTGLVSTSEDFGIQSEAPSHPELLDWLACEFMDAGWKLKHLHRLIVLSSTYRQSSSVSPELYERDPFNRLLARGPRFRVEGEIVRDISLAVSGLLNPKIGGRSVMPPAPAYLFQPPASYAPFPWVEETGAEKYRRALYTFRRRSTPYPMLQTFDVPNADFACVRRLRSNTPLQALVTLNEPMFMEAAQSLARRVLAEGGKSDAERVDYAFKLAVSRLPDSEERQELLALLEKQRKRIGEGWVNGYELAVGKSEKPENLPSGISPTQLAAYTVISRVLLNLDETVTKE